MTPTTWPTKLDLPDAVRAPMIALLNRQLADAINLTLQAKQAHWNVKGPQFASLHACFDRIAGELSELADELAERAVALGGIADGTLHGVAAETRLDAYPANLLSGAGHLQALAFAHAHFARTTRAAIDTAAAAGDATTADVFTEVSRGVDKLLWTLAAHLETPA